MKKLYTLMLLVGLFCCASCSEDDETFTTFPNPNWAVDLTGALPVSMSAFVCLPENLATYEETGDKLAAFVGDECRGVGEAVTVGTQKVYVILIKGTGSEQERISFKYYSSKNAYMYETSAFLNFEVDTRYGSADEAQVLPLTIVQ